MTNPNQYTIDLSDSRNIASLANGPIAITRNHLNVFYGKNGTGKTTFCMAIRHMAGDESYTLESLESLEYQIIKDPLLRPSITATGRIKNFACLTMTGFRTTALPQAQSIKTPSNYIFVTNQSKNSKRNVGTKSVGSAGSLKSKRSWGSNLCFIT